jgi:hypothetical protein
MVVSLNLQGSLYSMSDFKPCELVGLIAPLPAQIKESILEFGFFVQEFQNHSGIICLSIVENPQSHHGASASFDCSDCSDTLVGSNQNYWLAEDFESTFGGICHECAMRYFSDGSLIGLSNEAVMRLLIQIQTVLDFHNE